MLLHAYLLESPAQQQHVPPTFLCNYSGWARWVRPEADVVPDSLGLRTLGVAWQRTVSSSDICVHGFDYWCLYKSLISAERRLGFARVRLQLQLFSRHQPSVQPRLSPKKQPARYKDAAPV